MAKRLTQDDVTDRNLRVIAVAQAFKGTLSVGLVADALEQAIRAAGAEPVVLRASDGGDGLLDAMGSSLMRRTTHVVAGPLGAQVETPAGWLDSTTAVVESRLVCGLSLLETSARDPLKTTTRGVGQLVSALADAGATTVLVGLGGSATVDGGVGMARAWGFVPVDAAGTTLPDGGGALAKLAAFIKGSPPKAALVGLADVRNPLVGARGARVYAPQKGAGPEAVERLALGLDRLAGVAATEGRGDLAEAAGSGAAGGLGFGIRYFAGGTLVDGAAWFLERVRLSERLRGAALVVTGEGAFDATSLEGKLTGQVLAAAGRAGVPAALLAPHAAGVPGRVAVESGGGEWDAAELARRARILVEHALRAPRSR